MNRPIRTLQQLSSHALIAQWTKKLARGAALLTLLLHVAATQTSAQSVLVAMPEPNITYKNPVIRQDAPDPSVIKADDGYYYLYSTGEKIFRSKNLVNWVYVGQTFIGTNRPSFVEGVNRYWAPDINKIGDKYVLYFALSKWGGIDDCGIGVATANSPKGPFTPVNSTGKLFTSKEIGVRNSIDPFYIEDNGKKYCIWGSFWGGIWAIELSDDGLSVKPGAQKVAIASNAFEGSYVYKRGKYYYFFGSTGTCCEGDKSTYRTIYGRSTSLLGPYKTKNGGLLLDGKYDVLLKGNSHFAGTGHNAEFMEDSEGTTWILYHSYEIGKDLGRQVLLDRVLWTSDGWPYCINSEPSDVSSKPVIN